MLEVHLCFDKQLFRGDKCIRVFYAKNGKEFDVFKGDIIMHRGVDHLVFAANNLFGVLSMLLRNKIDFRITGS